MTGRQYMSNEVIRKKLIESINEITELLEACDDSSQEFELRMKLRTLFQQLNAITLVTLDAKSTEFNEAVASLNKLTESANEAKKDLGKVAQTLNKADKVVGKIEKLIKSVATRLVK